MKQINETTFTSDNGLITFIHGDFVNSNIFCIFVVIVARLTVSNKTNLKSLV